MASGNVTQPLAQLASTVPAAVPALPQAQTTGLTKGGWIAVLGTIAGAAAAIVVLTTRDDDTDHDAATRLAQVKAIQNLNAIATTAAATSTLATTVNTTANRGLRRHLQVASHPYTPDLNPFVARVCLLAEADFEVVHFGKRYSPRITRITRIKIRLFRDFFFPIHSISMTYVWQQACFKGFESA